jgi:hypothetical protein
MAFTYTVVRVTALAVNDQVAGFVSAAGGPAFVFTEPTGTGNTYPTTVKSIFTAPLPPGDVTAGDSLTTVYLNGNPFSLPIDFTLNGHSDWVIKATGSAA